MKALVVSYQYCENTFDFAHGITHTMMAIVVVKDGKNVAILVKDNRVHIYDGEFNTKENCNVLGEIEMDDNLFEQVEAAVKVQEQLAKKVEEYIKTFA